MGMTLAKNNIEKGHEVTDYDLKIPLFKWRSEEPNNDCGCFMMMHMMFFVGDTFNADLAGKERRVLYRAEILATLVLSDMNGSRNELLEAVDGFKKNKAELLPLLVEERKRKAEEAAEQIKKREAETRVQEEKQPEEEQQTRDEQMELKNKSVKKSKESKKKKEKEKKSNKDAEVDNTTIPETPVKTYEKSNEKTSPLSVLGSRVKGTSDGIGCTLNCGKPDKDAVMISNFMRGNLLLLSEMLLTRREAADYAFFDDDYLNLR